MAIGDNEVLREEEKREGERTWMKRRIVEEESKKSDGR